MTEDISEEEDGEDGGVKISSITNKGKEVYAKRPLPPQRTQAIPQVQERVQPPARQAQPQPRMQMQQPQLPIQAQLEENAQVDIWSIREVTVQTQPVIFNAETQEGLDANLAIVRILNKLENLERALKG
jgi:hypothetical protein